mgnify:CR=1 FL=1
MHKLDSVIYTGTATATGGRDGSAESSDGRLKTDLSVPKALGGDDGADKSDVAFIERGEHRDHAESNEYSGTDEPLPSGPQFDLAANAGN